MTQLENLINRLVTADATVEDVKYDGEVIRYTVGREWAEVGVAADGTDEWYVNVTASGFGRRCQTTTRAFGLGVAKPAGAGVDAVLASRRQAHRAMLDALAAAGLPVSDCAHA